MTLRFPRTAAEWRQCSDHYIMPMRMPVGIRSYDGILSRCGPYQTREGILKLFGAYPEDFRATTWALSAASWRLAYYIPSLTMWRLLDPVFEPAVAIVSSQSRDWLDDVPAEWFDPQSTPKLGLDKLRIELGSLSGDEAKAAWAILSFAKAIPLEPCEVGTLKWWSPSWFLGFAYHASDPEPPI